MVDIFDTHGLRPDPYHGPRLGSCSTWHTVTAFHQALCDGVGRRLAAAQAPARSARRTLGRRSNRPPGRPTIRIDLDPAASQELDGDLLGSEIPTLRWASPALRSTSARTLRVVAG